MECVLIRHGRARLVARGQVATDRVDEAAAERTERGLTT